MTRAMKDSGIEWVGQIPEHWIAKSIRYLVNEHISGSWGNDSVGNENDHICVRIADFNFSQMKLKENIDYTIRNYSYSEIHNKTLKKGDLLIEKSGGGEKTPVGRTVVFRLNQKCLFANFMDCIRLKNEYMFEYAKYCFFALYKNGVTNLYFNQTTGLQNLNIQKYFREVKLPVPPIDEQQKIADYLDKKCGEIDAITAEIQEQINTLEEYKKSVISETVTKGLNPNATMKDSGIEWIGKIPANWEIHPIYVYFSERKHKNRLGREDNLLSLSYGKIIRKDINTNGGLLPESFNTYNIVEAGDIIIRPTDLQNDKKSLRTGLSHEHGIITSAYIALRPNKNVNSTYYYYLLHMYDIQKVFYNMGNGVRQSLNYGEFAKLMVFSPSPTEQKEIAEYLDAKCVEIENAIADKQEQIKTLEEYKKTLIYEYVTGKKEVA